MSTGFSLFPQVFSDFLLFCPVFGTLKSKNGRFPAFDVF